MRSRGPGADDDAARRAADRREDQPVWHGRSRRDAACRRDGGGSQCARSPAPASTDATIERVAPSLEDVFIDVVDRADCGGRAMRGVRAVALKELRQIVRDRRTLVMLIFLPAFFLFLYGYALNFDIRHVRLAVEDRDHSQESRALVADFVRSTYFDIVATPTSADEASALIDRNGARAVLVIPSDFARRLENGRTAEVQVILDGDNANTATTVLGYVNAVLRSAPARQSPKAGRIARIEPRIWYNPELRSTVFLVPGLIAFISMITAVVSTALSIVREKERGTIEQVRMAPMSTLSFVVGKTVPYLLLSQIGAMSIVVAAMLPVRLADARVVAGAFRGGGALSRSGRSAPASSSRRLLRRSRWPFRRRRLLRSCRRLILSGFIFPIASMPAALQYISAVVPARYFLIALRGIVLKGLAAHDILGAHPRARGVRRRSRSACRRSGWPTIDETPHRHAHREGVPSSSRRSPQLLRLVIVAPILQLTMLGYAATTDVINVPIVVVDGDRSPRAARARRALRRVAVLRHRARGAGSAVGRARSRPGPGLAGDRHPAGLSACDLERPGEPGGGPGHSGDCRRH